MFYSELNVIKGYLHFCFNDTATTEIYTLSLHDALPIDPDAGRQREQEERQELHRPERGHLERGRVQHDHGYERQRDLTDLRAELADGLRRPVLQKIGMAPQATPWPDREACQHYGCSIAAGAAARTRMTSPLTVFPRTSTCGPSAPPSLGASESSSSEVMSPLIELQSTKTREPRRTPTRMSPEIAFRSIAPSTTASRRTSPETVFIDTEARASRIQTSPETSWPVTSPRARCSARSPEAVWTLVVPWTSSRLTSPLAVFTRASPSISSTVMSPDAVLIRVSPKTPRARTSADFVCTSSSAPGGHEMRSRKSGPRPKEMKNDDRELGTSTTTS